jgi:NitT/TauT family transport system permease protein
MKRRFAIGPTVALLCWAAITYTGLVKPLFVPPPHAVLLSLWKLTTRGPLLADLGVTFYRTLVAFFMSIGAGLLVGVPLGVSRRLYESCEVVFDFLRSMPSPALIPLAMLVFGLGDASRIAVAGFTCSLINAIQAAYAVRSIPRQRIQAARLAGVHGRLLLFDVLVPSALPTLVAGWRITLSLALIIVVVTEMFIGTNTGLGMRILDLHLMFRTADMYSAILVVGLLGYTLNKAVELAERRVIHWTET